MKRVKLLPYLFLGLMACQPKPNDEIIDPVNPPVVGKPTEVGQPIGAPITKTIGPIGGTVITPDGKLTLTFPAGAVRTETAITVQAVENKAPNGVGIGYHISPDNLAFEQPVTFDYVYQDKEVTGSSVDALGLALQDEKKVWQLAQPVVVNKSKKTVTAKVKKAKWWALVTEYRLLPEKDTVLVTETRDIKLMHLRSGRWADWASKPSEASLEDLLAPLTDPEEMANRDIVGLDLNGVSWSGVPPQEQTWGAISWSQKDARILYVAPGKKPTTKNPVVVTVEIMNPTSRAKLMVSSELYIKEDNTFSLDGRTFSSQLKVDAATDGGRLYINLHGIDSTGKNATLAILLKGPKVGSFPFTSNDDLVVGSMNYAAKEDYAVGASVYDKCKVSTASEGTVHITHYEKSKGYLTVSCRVTGALVTLHEDGEKCQVIKHLTTKVYAEFTTVVKQ